MTIEFIIKIGILAAMATLVGMICYLMLSRDSSYLLERLKRGRAAKRKKLLDDLLEIVKPLTEANLKSIKGKNNAKDILTKLGLPSSDADIMYFENKRTLRLLIVGTISILLAFIVAGAYDDSKMRLPVWAICVLGPSYFAYASPIWALQRKIKIRDKAFEKFFPDAIDLLCVCVEAGLSIDSAIERVGREFVYFSPEVGNEFSRVAKDMLSGSTKQEALKGLAERIENKDIQSFVAVIIQADKMGASISSSLQVSADSLRTKRKQRLEALVSSASTKMTVPLVLCLLPATFAVILTPAIIQVVESLGKMNAFK